MFVERAQDADAHVTRLTVEPHRLVTMFTTLNVLLSLHVKQRVTLCHLQHNIYTGFVALLKRVLLVYLFIYIIKSYAKYTVNDKKEKRDKDKNKKKWLNSLSARSVSTLSK